MVAIAEADAAAAEAAAEAAVNDPGFGKESVSRA
jgi:hypothetical protein